MKSLGGEKPESFDMAACRVLLTMKSELPIEKTHPFLSIHEMQILW